MPLRPTALRPDATVASLTAASYAAERVGQLDAVEVRLGQRHVRAGAGHQVGVAGRRPAGDPAAVAVLLDEPVGDLGGDVRVQQRVGGPHGAVGVPEAVVDVDLAVDDLRAGLRGGRRAGRRRHRARVLPARRGGGAGVLRLRVRVEVQPVQVRVERDQLRLGGAPHLDQAEPVLPRRRRGGVDLVEALAGDLQVEVAAAPGRRERNDVARRIVTCRVRGDVEGGRGRGRTPSAPGRRRRRRTSGCGRPTGRFRCRPSR